MPPSNRTMTLLAVLIGGALWYLSDGIHHVWILAWLAPVPVLAILPELRLSRAAIAAFGASVIGGSSFVVAYRGLPPALLLTAVLLVAIPFTIAALGWRTVARRGHSFIALVTYPALVVSADYLISLVSPHGTYGSPAYSQADVPVLLQVAAVTGILGISFVMSFVSAAVTMAWLHRSDARIVSAALLLGALPVIVMVVFGMARLQHPAPAGQIRLGLAASDVEAGRHSGMQEAGDALPVVRAYAQRAATLARRGAEIVVLPEKFVGIMPEYADNARTILGDTSRDRKVTIVAGLNFIGSADPRNVAVVVGPDGNVALEYDKQYLVPGLEDGYRHGATIGLLPGRAPPVGIAICKDLDFVPLGRAYARAGVGLLLVPAWDFVNDGWLHSRMAVLRGVEGGYAVARSAANGLLTVSDARGRILAERASGESADVLLNAVVPVAAGGTFYSRTGDWFAWVSMVAAAACLARTRARGTASRRGRIGR